MEYVLLVFLIGIMLFISNRKSGKVDNNVINKEAHIKQTVINSIFVNSLIITPFIVAKLNGTIMDVAFFWIINFVVPYYGFQKLFKDS